METKEKGILGGMVAELQQMGATTRYAANWLMHAEVLTSYLKCTLIVSL